MAESKITVDNTAVWVGNISSSNTNVVSGACDVYRSGKLIQVVFDTQQKSATANTIVFQGVPKPRRNLRLALVSNAGKLMALNVNTSGTITTSASPSPDNNDLYFSCTAVYIEGN